MAIGRWFRFGGGFVRTPCVASAPGHVAKVRELVIDALSPGRVRIALVYRPSFGSGSRRTRLRCSRRLIRCDSRDREALVTSASSLIRIVWPGFSDSRAKAWYSMKLSPASCWSWHSSAQRSLTVAAAKARQERCCSSSSQRGASAAAVRVRVRVPATLRGYHPQLKVQAVPAYADPTDLR